MNPAAWTCLALPLAATIAITAGGTSLSRRTAAYISTATAFGSFVAAYGLQNTIDMIDGALARSA